MRGQREHRLLATMRGARRIGRGSICGRLLDLQRHPGAVSNRHARARVVGELWEMDRRPGVLAALDRYEGFDRRSLDTSLFVRRRASVRVPSGRVVRAWAYFLRRVPVSASIVTGGDWRVHRRRRGRV